MKNLFLILPLAVLVLNSCRSYIGQRAFERAEYTAFCLPADISAESGRQVLSDGKGYYMELPRYRNMPRALNFIDSMGAKIARSEQQEVVSGVSDLYRLHPALAHYVTGRSGNKPSDLEGKITLVDTPEPIRARCTEQLPIVKSVDKDAPSQCWRRVTSPHATAHKAWGYTATVLVDAPVTVAQNVALAAGFVAGWAGCAIVAPVAIPLQQCQQQKAEEQSRGTESPRADESPVYADEAH